MPQDPIHDGSTLVQVMAWCRQATSHYLGQCWTRCMLLYGIIRPQWVNHVWQMDWWTEGWRAGGWMDSHVSISKRHVIIFNPLFSASLWRSVCMRVCVCICSGDENTQIFYTVGPNGAKIILILVSIISLMDTWIHWPLRDVAIILKCDILSHVTHWITEKFTRNCSQVNATEPHWW